MKQNQVVRLSSRLLSLILCVGVFPVSQRAQNAVGREVMFPVMIAWPRQPAITRYRLQIAADETFQNIYFDRRLVGNRYSVSELSPGYYYWRVASADTRLGSFSRPIRFFISGGVVTSVIFPNQRTAQPAPTIRPRRH